MAEKKVLVSYLERNKVGTIPAETIDGDVSYVVNECRKMFGLGECANVVVVLQKFDSEWDAFVDMEEGDALSNRDKVKVVVMPILDEGSKTRISASPSSGDMSEVCGFRRPVTKYLHRLTKYAYVFVSLWSAYMYKVRIIDWTPPEIIGPYCMRVECKLRAFTRSITADFNAKLNVKSNRFVVGPNVLSTFITSVRPECTCFDILGYGVKVFRNVCGRGVILKEAKFPLHSAL